MITAQDIENNTMFIGDTDIADYGALVENFKVGAVEVENSIYQGVNRTNFNALKTVRKMRPIAVNIFYQAETRRELSIIKSTLDALMDGKVELFLPDGFFYSSYLLSAGEEQILGVENNKVIAICAYTFNGIRHDALETIEVESGETMTCKSTVPYTDCRLTCTASQAYPVLNVDGVTITNVAANDVITVDGILGRILQNGAPCAGNMNFRHFPSLVPGVNTITCPETLTVEYYPTY